jgi:hypothetical protein
LQMAIVLDVSGDALSEVGPWQISISLAASQGALKLKYCSHALLRSKAGSGLEI